MDRLYIRARLTNGETRHLMCKQPSSMNGADRDDVASDHTRAFIERADEFASEWLPTAEGTHVARESIVDVTPVRVDVDQPPWKWALQDDRVLPLTQ